MISRAMQIALESYDIHERKMKCTSPENLR